MGLKDQIIAASDRPFEDVAVPEWGVTVRILTMSANERDKFELDWGDAKKRAEMSDRSVAGGDKTARRDLPADDPANVFRARYLSACMADSDGNLIFSQGEAAALGKKSGKVVDRLYSIAKKLNPLSPEDEKELAKNS